MKKLNKYKIVIVLLSIISVFYFEGSAEAANADDSRSTVVNEVGISFFEEDIQPITPKLPSVIPDTPIMLKPSGRLPSTGELITSLIWMLTGFSILVVFIGIISLKKMMLKIA